MTDSQKSHSKSFKGLGEEMKTGIIRAIEQVPEGYQQEIWMEKIMATEDLAATFVKHLVKK